MQRPTFKARRYLSVKGEYIMPHKDIPWYLNMGLPLAAIPVVITMVVGFIYLTAPADVSQQFVVFTGRLTRNMGHPNGYVVTPDNGTEYTRLYYCMMDSGIASDKCGSKSPVVDFQECVQSVHDCNPSSDRAWPRDYSFLSCLQSNFNVSQRQTNVFLACLDSSEGVMNEVFETPDSNYFLGSYNYVAFLLGGLAVMSSFVVATAGGVYFGNPIAISTNGHISGINPLSWWCVSVAFVWNFSGLCWALGMAYIQKAVLFGDYPVSLWTAGLLLSVFAIATGYFFSYLIEYIYDRVNNNAGYSQVGPEQGEVDSRYPRSQRVGIKRGDPLVGEDATDYDWQVIAPLMVRTFGWCWLLADGLIFVGLLQPQSSIINSYAVRVYFGVTLARLFQLVSSYFANQAYINRSTNPEKWSNATDPKEFGAHMVCLFAHLASLPLLLDSLYHSGWSQKLYTDAVTGVSANNALWLFLILIGVLPELVRMGILLYVSFSNPSVDSILILHELLFAWDWITRALVVVIVVATATPNLRDAQASMRTFNQLFL
jgi:hypothetical protein